MKNKQKDLSFVGSCRKDLLKFPTAVRRHIGFDLHNVQCGETPETAKPLRGLPGVMELVEDYDKDTYRAVYVANIGNVIYVLHCFKKKSKQGIKTPKKDLDLIRERLRVAQEDSKRKKSHDR
jgi:phage-related protein